MDADTVMSENFLERRASPTSTTTPDLDAVGGVFFGDQAPGLLATAAAQRVPALRTRHLPAHERVFVLTGTASLFRADALQAVAAEPRARAARRTSGHVYDTLSAHRGQRAHPGDEDARRPHGVARGSAGSCTELMPTRRDLWHQRQRWQRGALGEHRHVRRHVGDRAVLDPADRHRLRGARARSPTSLVMVLSFIAFGMLTAGRVLVACSACSSPSSGSSTVWDGGWRARLLAAPLVIELAYDWFLQMVYVKSLLDIALGRSEALEPRALRRDGAGVTGWLTPRDARAAVVRIARRLRRLQHAGLRRPVAGQAVAPSPPVGTRAWRPEVSRRRGGGRRPRCPAR